MAIGTEKYSVACPNLLGVDKTTPVSFLVSKDFSVMQILAIAIGGAFGAVMRFWTSSAVYSVMGKSFPWGTLAVNVLGSLAMGVLATLVVEKVVISPELKNAILIGFLGAFTTFSTFSLDTLNLIYQGHAFKAFLNAVLSVVLCLAATWAGAVWARQW